MDALIDNFFNAQAFQSAWGLMWRGLLNLLQLVVVSFAVALVVGAVLLWLRTSRFRLVRSAQVWFIDTIRALPPLVSLVIVFYLVPPIYGFTLNTFWTAVLTFGLIQGAYISEIYRGGLAAISSGQYEAASAVGFSPVQTVRYIIAPQVFRVIIPPLTSQATQLVRDSSLTFFIGYEEVVTRARQAVTLTSNSTPYTIAVVLYGVILISLQLISSRLERQRRRTP